MSYQEMYERYRDPEQRGRHEMCVREQGFIFSNDGRPDIAALGRGVTSGLMTDVDAVIAAVVVGPSSSGLIDDAVLLAAVQFAWPTVAAARYPAA